MSEFPPAAKILQVFEREPTRTLRLRELVLALGLRSSQARELKSALKELARERRVVTSKKGHFALGGGRHEVAEARRSRQPAIAAGEKRHNLIAGRLIGHRDGYGFVVPDAPVAGTSQDIFIPPDSTGSAMHGDRVEVLLVSRSRPAHGGGRARGHDSAGGERLAGRVVRVTERAQKTVVGEFHCGARRNYVLPFDHRVSFEIVIPRGAEAPEGESSRRNRQFGGESEQRVTGGAARKSASELDGLIVDVELTTFPDPVCLQNPQGRVVEVLGARDDFGVDVEIVIRKYHLPHRFPGEVLEEAAAAPQFVADSAREGRRDFRALPIVTIDGETAKDFDDAVAVERLAGGTYRLQVHIADVAHYVRPGTALDREARLRGTSVYFPDRAVPMLPLELSNGICSLNPRVDRLVMSALMEIDATGRVMAYELVPGIIRSAHRCTYTEVFKVLSGDREALLQYRGQVEHFRLMEELGRILKRRRAERGSIDFDLPEPEVEFDELGRMVGVTRSERNIAHRIVEEFMLVANETVAQHLERKGVPALYRIHEKPDPKKVIEFEEIAATFGYSLGVELPATRRVRVHRRDERERYPRFAEGLNAEDLKITSRHYQRLTERIAGKPEERILSYLMLRSLKQARYSEENLGHFALASPTYTHFTSPIRRYPDLIVHRILKAVLESERGNPSAPPENPASRHAAPIGQRKVRVGTVPLEAGELHAIGLETSESERRAADAERELMDWKKVSFMAGRLGEEFDALAIGLTRHGFFVELVDLFVEGFVPLESLEDDTYVYRERQRAIVAVGSKKAYHLGARVRVRLDRIDRSGNRLEFSCVN